MPDDVDRHRFVVSTSTHDQVGNRATGDRLSHLVSPGRLAIGAALMLTSPYTPMLFMGEEWGASTKWAYFTDHTDSALAQAVSKGRRAEFAEHGWGDEVPDPQAASTMADSVLRWEERDEPVHAALLAWYRELIRLRRAVSDLRDPSLTSGRAERDGDLLTVHRGAHRVVANLGTEPTRVERLEELPDDPSQTGGVRRQDRLLVSDEEVDRPRGEQFGLSLVVKDLQRRFADHVEALPVDGGLDLTHRRVDRTPHPDCGLGAVRKCQTGLDEAVDAAPGIGLGLHRRDDLNRRPLLPVGHQLLGVGGPVGEVVIEGSGRHAETLTHLGEFEAAVAQLGQGIEARFEECVS